MVFWFTSERGQDREKTKGRDKTSESLVCYTKMTQPHTETHVLSTLGCKRNHGEVLGKVQNIREVVTQRLDKDVQKG